MASSPPLPMNSLAGRLTSSGTLLQSISDARSEAIQRMSGVLGRVTPTNLLGRRSLESSASSSSPSHAQQQRQISSGSVPSRRELSDAGIIRSPASGDVKTSQHEASTTASDQNYTTQEPRAAHVSSPSQNIIVSIPPDHWTASNTPQIGASTTASDTRSPSDTRSSYAVVAVSALPLGERLIGRGRGFVRQYVIEPVCSDPFVSSLGVLLTSTISYMDDLRLNGRVVAEDPMPHIRRLLRYAFEQLVRAVKTREFGLALVVFTAAVSLARMGFFYSNKSAVSSSMEPIVFSPLTPNERTISSLPVSSPVSPKPIVEPMASLSSSSGALKDGARGENGNSSHHPLSDGTIATVASRFLGLFTNNSSSPSRAAASGGDSAIPPVESPLMVVNRGTYIETYELRMTSAASPILEDPDRFVSNLIESHVREEREKSPHNQA